MRMPPMRKRRATVGQISVPADAWERVFGAEMHAHDHDWPQDCAECKRVAVLNEAPPIGGRFYCRDHGTAG
jgi:hypothetical protein